MPLPVSSLVKPLLLLVKKGFNKIRAVGTVPLISVSVSQQ